MQQRGPQRIEEGGEMLYRQLAEHLRKHARDQQPVLERVARARGRLRAVAHHPPAAVGRARQVGGILQQVAAANRLQPFGRGQEAAVAEDHRRRDGAALHQGLVTVEVAEDAVEQVGALLDAGGDRLPFVGRQQQRDRVDLPRSMRAGGVGIDVVGDAVIANLPLGQLERVADVALAALGERAREGVPVRSRPAGRAEQFVVAIIGRRIAGQERVEHGQ